MTNKEWSLKKKIIVGILVGILIFALVIGVVYIAVYSNMGKVRVIPVSDAIGYDSDSDQYTMEGSISTGVTQDVTTEDGKVSEILVKVGDYVEKGTALVRLDATEAQLQLEQAKIDLQSKQVDLNNAYAKQEMLNNAQSYVETIKVPVDSDDEDSSESDSDSSSESSDSSSDSESSDDSDSDSESSEESDSDSDSSEESDSDSDSSSDSSDSSSDSESESSEESDSETEYKEVVVETDEPQFQTSDGTIYSESELRKEKTSTENDIRDLQTDIKEAQVNIENAQETLDNCTVKATLDGYVTKVSETAIKSDTSEEDSDEDEEELDGEIDTSSDIVSDTDDSMEDDGVIVQVSSLDGLFVKSAMSEWRLEKFGVGDTVYVMDWESGNTYKATITTISSYASEYYSQMYQYMGGTSSSYYPFTAQITEDGTGLTAGDYVDVSFSASMDMDSDEEEYTEDGPISLMKAFVRTENGKKYVYVRGENDKLKKQYVTVDSQSQETYTISEGLTYDDYIAFPYGNNVREGALTVEGSIDELYE
ncbi:MAG: biotin/lipoyl-binding protein [Lachnospiraceae bacterium]|nr:biotin/lipoyl-binding protein [Lachnospiraceae bacterium]